MKKLTKSFFKKEIKENMKTGLSSLQAMERLINEFEMYEMVIMAAHTDVLLESI